MLEDKDRRALARRTDGCGCTVLVPAAVEMPRLAEPFGGFAWHEDTASQDASRAAAIADAEDAGP